MRKLICILAYEVDPISQNIAKCREKVEKFEDV